jgi:hydroxyethylthiazole kinase-like uncharacterized protein yjeF
MSGLLLLDSRLLGEYPLPDHPGDADKNDRGLALFIAGSRELAGAALLAGMGALRAGAGRLRIATSQSVAPGVGVALPEARVIAFSEDADGCIDPAAIADVVARCRGVDSLTIGPGMQPGAALAALIGQVLEGPGEFPLIFDAAALGVLPVLAEQVRVWRGGVILLPHVGEMARLLECDKAAVAADPFAAACRAAGRFGATVMIKGEHSYIVAPEGPCFRYRGGGIGLATSGSGDVLAGIVGGLAARGADCLTALLWGVYLHGEAGRILARTCGTVGFLARELLDLVPGFMDAPDRLPESLR